MVVLSVTSFLRVTGDDAPARRPAGGGERRRGVGPVLFHPDYTVGPGIAPDLLTSPMLESARGLGVAALPPVGNLTPP